MADYISKTNEGKCIFCEIAKGNISTPGVFWEDDEFIAFLSKWPNTEGFTVVVPKKHFEDVGRVGLIMEGTGVDHAHIKLFPMHGTGYLLKGKWKQHPSEIDTYFDEYKGYIASNDGPEADEDELRDLSDRLRKTNDE